MELFSKDLFKSVDDKISAWVYSLKIRGGKRQKLGKSPCDSDIFSIIGDNILQRKVSPSSSVSGKNVAQTSSRLLSNFFRVSIDELTDLKNMKNEQIQEYSLPLPSVYISLVDNEPTMFHQVEYSNFFSFGNSSNKTEIIKINPDSKTMKIIYEAKLRDIVIKGKSEVNETCHDFILNITEPVLEAVYEKKSSDLEKIIPNSVSDTFRFTGYSLIIESNSSTENEIFKSPNSQILPQLASTWLVKIFNAVNSRFIKPKIIEHNDFLLKNSKNRLLQEVCHSIANYIDTTQFEDIIKEESTIDTRNYDYYAKLEYTYRNIMVANFKYFEDCISSSQSLFLEEWDGHTNIFSHRIDLVFKSLPVKSSSPTLQWISSIQKKSNNYGTSHESGPNAYQIYIKQWSVKLLAFTDALGVQVGSADETKVDFELINFDDSYGRSSKINQTRFIESFEQNLAQKLGQHVRSAVRASRSKKVRHPIVDTSDDVSPDVE